MSNMAEIRLLKVFASTAPISGVNAAKKRQKAATVFLPATSSVLRVPPDAYSPKSAAYRYASRQNAHFVLYQHHRCGASKMAMIIPGTTTSMMPICTKRVVRKIRINNLGNIGALAPIARSALTL